MHIACDHEHTVSVPHLTECCHQLFDAFVPANLSQEEHRRGILLESQLFPSLRLGAVVRVRADVAAVRNHIYPCVSSVACLQSASGLLVMHVYCI